MSNKKFNIVAAGRAYTDIVATVNLAFLNKYNLAADSQHQFPLTVLTAMQANLPACDMFAGGPSGNTAAMVIALGGSAGYFGKVFDDAAGKFFVADFAQRDVVWCCEPYTKEVGLSGTCLVLITDQQRTFAYNPGCANHFSVNDFNDFVFTETDFFLLEGHLLTNAQSLPALEFALTKAKNITQVVINLHGIVSWQAHGEIAKLIADCADIVIGNDVEQAAFKKFSARTPLLVTTKGSAGAEALQNEVVTKVAAVTPKQFVNTVGAGDAFTAGLLLSLSRNKSLQQSLQAGVEAAAMIIAEVSARPSLILGRVD